MEPFWKDNHFTVRWDTIPEVARWSGEWKDFRHRAKNNALRYLVLWRHKSDDGGTSNISLPKNLDYLELNWSNAKTIGPLPAGLRRLELHYCLKLESARELAANCPNLRHLHLNTCKKFHDVASLLELRKVEVLCLNSCGALPDLKFLLQFPNLRDFRFVNTNVIAGDLSPLLSHPTLESVGTLDKRHYNLKADEIGAALAARSTRAPSRRTGRRT